MSKTVFPIALLLVAMFVTWSCTGNTTQATDYPPGESKELAVKLRGEQGDYWFVGYDIVDSKGTPKAPEGYAKLSSFGRTYGSEHLVLFFDIEGMDDSSFEKNDIKVVLELGEGGRHFLPYQRHHSEPLAVVVISDLMIPSGQSAEVSVMGKNGISAVTIDGFGRDPRRESGYANGIDTPDYSLLAEAKRYLPQEEAGTALTAIEVQCTLKRDDLFVQITSMTGTGDMLYNGNPMGLGGFKDASGGGMSSFGIAKTGPIIARCEKLSATFGYRVLEVVDDVQGRLLRKGEGYIIRSSVADIELRRVEGHDDRWEVSPSLNNGFVQADFVHIESLVENVQMFTLDPGKEFAVLRSDESSLRKSLNKSVRVRLLKTTYEGEQIFSAHVQDQDAPMTQVRESAYEVAGTIVYVPAEAI